MKKRNSDKERGGIGLKKKERTGLGKGGFGLKKRKRILDKEKEGFW